MRVIEPGEHFGSHRADAPDTYDHHTVVADLLIVAHDPHPLQRHQPRVGVTAKVSQNGAGCMESKCCVKIHVGNQ